jgi:hypothetical protein
MRNFDEHRKIDKEITTADIAAKERKSEAEVLPFQRPEKAGSASDAALLPEREGQELHSRWDAIQTSFVDEPRKAVEEADKLVASAIQRLAQVFSAERSNLEGQWSRGDEVSTEDLRLALQRYRAFFTRLLSI